MVQDFAVNADKQRLDSVHIKSNMRRLGRIGIFSTTIHTFLKNLKRQHPELIDTVDRQVMETYSTEDKEDALRLITPVQVEQAHQSDANALLPAIESAETRNLKPKEILADSLYGSDDNCQKAETHDVEVVAPVMGETKKDGFSLSDFQISDKGLVLACPLGHAPAKVKQGKRYSVGFDAAICDTCPERSRCPVKKGKKFCYLRFTEKDRRIAKRRLYEQTEEFKDRYRCFPLF